MANSIFLLAKDEDDILLDFIIYHHAALFDHIYILDDGSNNPIDSLIKELPMALQNIVTILRLDYNFYDQKQFENSAYYDADIYTSFSYSKQMYFCNFACKRLVNPQDWIAFVDADEFIDLGSFHDIRAFRSALQEAGFNAVVLDQILFGHGFNITPPVRQNVCSYLWCAAHFYGHGKFFAQAGSVKSVLTPHFPTLYDAHLIADSELSERKTEFYPDVVRTKANSNLPHLKHFIIQDVTTCFKRRLRPRISGPIAVDALHPSWVDRVRMLHWTSMKIDMSLALQIIQRRDEAGMETSNHIEALAAANSKIKVASSLSSAIDYNHLRVSLGSSSENEAELLYSYFKSTESKVSWLRFLAAPEDFDPETYKSFNEDLAHLSDRELLDHFVIIGHKKRTYK